MPEGPEIERMRLALEPELTDRVVNVRVLMKHKKFPLVAGQHHIYDVERVGKRLGIHAGTQTLIVGAGMTGRWRVAAPSASPVKHDIFELVRDDGSRVVYNDVRRFGSASWVPHSEWRAGLGIDFADTRLAVANRAMQEYLREQYKSLAKRPIKVALLDQSRIAGIGNVYASELCWHLRVHPERPIAKFDRWRALGVATHRILCCAVRGKGMRDGRATVKYQHRPVPRGGYTVEVYDQTGQPCSRCGTPIASAELGGRSTYWCPTCQPE